MTRPKIILDCDPGCDDLFAIYTAARWCELVAITTVTGNVGIDHTTKNALAAVTVSELDIPVHQGASHPYVGEPRDAADVHGESGLGAVTMPSTLGNVAGTDAVGTLLDATSGGDVHVVAIGPLTNIARAVELDPTWPSRVPSLSVMGGSTTVGNVTAAAEFNIWADPEAAAIVFDAGFNLTMAGLNLTHQVRMGASDVDSLRSAATPTAVFAADALDHYSQYSLSEFGVPKTAMHDPCAVLAITHPELFESARHHVVVELAGEHTRGMTLVDQRQRPDQPNTTVLFKAQEAAIVDLIMQATIDPQPPNDR